jgi:large subunit ribosomal protein L17
VAGRKLGRTAEHRLATLRNLSTALFEKEKIKTTLSKAKELRPFAEKLVTLSKKETLHARRLVLRHIHDRSVVAKLLDTLSARYAQRPGGYTRIIKLGPRRGDNAEMAVIELLGSDAAPEAPKKGKSKAPRKRTKTTRKTTKARKPRAKPAADEGDEKPVRKKATKKKKTAAKKGKGKTSGSATKSAGSGAKKKASKGSSRSKTGAKGKAKDRG